MWIILVFHILFLVLLLLKVFNFLFYKSILLKDTDIDLVLKNPAQYLYVVKVVTYFISTILFFSLGYIIYSYSKKIILAIIIQATPFLSPWQYGGRFWELI